jgi:hypothetical protein
LRAYIELGLITCLRLTELYRLRGAGVTTAVIRGRPEATKVETARRQVPLDARAAAWLEFLRRDPAGRLYSYTAYVFGRCGNPPVDINDAFNTLLLRAFPARDAAGQALPREWVNGKPGPVSRRQLSEIDLLSTPSRGALRKYRRWHLNRFSGRRPSEHPADEHLSGGRHDDFAQAMTAHGSGAKQALDECRRPWMQLANPGLNADGRRRRQKSVSVVS